MNRKKLLAAVAGGLLATSMGVGADQIVLTGVIRDFKQSHADMQRSSGSPFGVYTEMVLPVLGADGKPQLNVGEINCHFDDTQVTVISVAHEISNVVLKYADGTTEKFDGQSGYTHVYEGTLDNTGKQVVGCWVKAGSNGSGDGPGFGLYFDMNDADLTQEYIPDGWRVESSQSFGQWFRDVPDANISMPYAISLEPKPGYPDVYYYAREKQLTGPLQYFFPIDGLGWGDTAIDKNGDHRNFYFTYEIHTEFTFVPADERDYELTFTFTGDDDVWVFINGKLAVDIGGVHGQATRSVNLDTMAEELGLEPGNNYALDFFFAERHTTESNFRIETTLQLVEIPPTSVSPLYD